MSSKATKTNSKKAKPPATTPEGRENQLISLAYDAAEKQLLEGTASSQVITHFLKLGTIKARLELESLTKDIELKDAKTQAIKSDAESEEMYKNAVEAMRRYTGSE